QLVAAKTGPLAEMTVSHVITGGGGPSRGSLRSALATIDAMTGGGLTYHENVWRTGLPARHQMITLPDGQSVAMASLPLCEVVTIPRHVEVDHVETLVEAALKARLGTPVTAELIDSLPDGPADHDRAGQRFTYLIDALDHQGHHTRGTIRGRDTYGTTAVIAVEAAMRLATGDITAGVLTAAQAFDPVGFLDALSDHGLSWTIQETKTMN
ncbi:MAG: saccharopine dehydrogenase family protein, partial [Stackebrandtia sp.]